MNEKLNGWKLALRIITTVLTAIAGVLGVSSCMNGDPSQAACAASCATTAMVLHA